MANKGSSGYIKRLYAPRYFAVHKKEFAYTTKQNPGRHSLKKSVALSLLVEKLNLSSNRLETNKIIKSGSVVVNGKIIKEPKYPVGLNDAITVGKENYTIGINNKAQIQINKNEKAVKTQVYKVLGKYKYKNNNIMIMLHDGSIIKAVPNVKKDDSVLLSDRKITKVLKLDAGSSCEIIDGVHVGKSGKIKEMREGNIHKQKSVVVEQKNGEEFETLVKNIIVIE